MTIYRNLIKLNKAGNANLVMKKYIKCVNSRLGWYRRSGMDVVNFTLFLKVLAIQKEERPGLVNPLEYYLKSL